MKVFPINGRSLFAQHLKQPVCGGRGSITRYYTVYARKVGGGGGGGGGGGRGEEFSLESCLDHGRFNTLKSWTLGLRP